MNNNLSNEMYNNCPTKVFVNGQMVNLRDVRVIWSDHWGDPHTGGIEDFAQSRADDAVSEAEAGEGW